MGYEAAGYRAGYNPSVRRLATPPTAGPEPVRPFVLERFSAWPGQVLLIALATLAAYGHTLDVPFYLDDFSSIQENPLIYQWQGFEALRHFGPLRILCYLTFELNYRLGHFHPFGYHQVNILIHFLAGVAVYGLARGLLRTPRLAGTARQEVRTWLPLFVAALFVLHPLQTQAVTYTVQRLASMAAMLYIASLAAYVQARLAQSAGPRFAWAAACFALTGLALFTKENTATLPLAFLLIEVVLFAHRRLRLLQLAGVAAGEMALVWLVAALAFGRNPFSIAALGGLTSQTAEIPRGAYFATQMPVLWTYLRLFFWPVGLHLDYAVDLLRGFANAQAGLALAGHVLVIALALAAWRRRPLVTFALLLYYLAHAVESSLIPIPELAFEHRTYLPNLGLCLLVGWLLVAEAPRWPGSGRVVAAIAGVFLLVMGIVTWQRNQQWRDPVALWQDNVRLAPAKARAWGNLGKSLLEANRPEEAEKALRQSQRMQTAGFGSAPGSAVDAINLIAALQMLERDDEALTLIAQLQARPLEPPTRALLDLNRGNIHFNRHAFAAAESCYRAALALEPGNLTARANLASTLAQTGRFASAESLFQQVLEVNPDDASSRENLRQLRKIRLGARAPAR